VEFLRRVHDDDNKVQVWTARADPMSAAPLSLPTAQMVRHQARFRRGESPRIWRGKLRARVSRHVADAEVDRVTVFLGDAARAPKDDRRPIPRRPRRRRRPWRPDVAGVGESC
jgi:hypothetical protein